VRHSAHHAAGGCRHQILRAFSEDEAPQLAHGYATMYLLAFPPALWFHVMDPRAEKWRDSLMEVAITGRRERKKRAVRDAILESATRMFVEKGFDHTRIDAIAEEADVAVGTVYNHFATKGDILVAILIGDVQEVVARTQLSIARPVPDTAQAVMTVSRAVVDTMNRRPRALWRQLFGQSMIDPALASEFIGAKRLFCELLKKMLEHQRNNGDLDPRFDVEGACEISFAINNSLIDDYVRDDAFSAEDFSATGLRLLKLVFGS